MFRSTVGVWDRIDVVKIFSAAIGRAETILELHSPVQQLPQEYAPVQLIVLPHPGWISYLILSGRALIQYHPHTPHYTNDLGIDINTKILQPHLSTTSQAHPPLLLDSFDHITSPASNHVRQRRRRPIQAKSARIRPSNHRPVFSPFPAPRTRTPKLPLTHHTPATSISPPTAPTK